MTLKLFMQAITRITFGLILTGVLLFLPAGTFCFYNGWLFMGVVFVPVLLAGAVLMFKNPTLLKKRLNIRESQREQKAVLFISAIMFTVGFVICGLDFRFSWSSVPDWAVFIACILFLAGYALYVEVIRENAYLSRIIEVQQNQKVIDTGLYSVVRHPMYFATVIMFILMPIILGSVVALFVFCIYPFAIVKRIKNEEKLLEEQLEGYKAYKQKVKWRIIPFIW